MNMETGAEVVGISIMEFRNPVRKKGEKILTQVICFAFLAVLFGAPLTWLMIHAARTGLAEQMVIHGLMWSVAIAALVTSILWGRSFAELGFRRCERHYALIAYSVPLIVSLTIYMLAWKSGLAQPNFSGFATRAGKELSLDVGAGIVMIALILSIGVIQACASAIGEEIGWRGFLVPLLSEKLRLPAVTFYSGILWGAWHLPLVIGTQRHATNPATLVAFFAGILAAAGIAAWLRLASSSIWPPTIFHAAHNSIVHRIFDASTVEPTSYLSATSEMGWLLPIGYGLVFYIIYRRYTRAASKSST